MKKILSALLVAAMICTLAISASAIKPYLFTAEDGEVELYGDMTVLKGTPVVDGKMDDIYKLSDFVNAPSHRGFTWGTGLVTDQSVDLTLYMLWDDNYFYMYGTMLDSTPGVMNDDPTQWCNDGVEIGFKATKGEYEGQVWLSMRADGSTNEPGAGVAAADCNYVAILNDDGHTFEIAIPLPALGAGMVYQVGTIQAIDIYDSLALDIVTKRVMPDDAWVEANKEAGDLDETPDFDEIFVTLSAEEVGGSKTEETKADETQADTTAKEDEKVDEKVDAPQTFDAGIIAAVAAIVSAAGYAISKKR